MKDMNTKWAHMCAMHLVFVLISMAADVSIIHEASLN